MEREGSGSIKVLLIPPVIERNYDTFFKLLRPEFRKTCTFYCVKPIPRCDNGTVNYPSLLDQCCKIILEEHIKVIFANKKIGTLALGVLIDKFPHLNGPTMESLFLCNHQYYTTTIVDSREPKLPFAIEYMDNNRIDKYDAANRILRTVNVPCYMRSCLSSGHTAYGITNRDGLIKAYDKCKTDAQHIVNMQKYLIDKFVDAEKYPLAIMPVVLLNTSVDPFYDSLGSPTYSLVNVEACVYKGEVIPWAVCDTVHPSRMFAGLEMPTKISQKLQERLWCEVKLDVLKLTQYGFNNSFIHGEYVVYDDGYIHLINLSGCPHTLCNPMYNKALNNGNNIEASIKLCTGVRPKTPTPKGNCVLCQNMQVFESGKADNLFRFDIAMKNPDVNLRYLPGQDIIIEPAKDSAMVGSIVASGKTYSECAEKIKVIRSEIIKLPETLPFSR